MEQARRQEAWVEDMAPQQACLAWGLQVRATHHRACLDSLPQGSVEEDCPPGLAEAQGLVEEDYQALVEAQQDPAPHLQWDHRRSAVEDSAGVHLPQARRAILLLAWVRSPLESEAQGLEAETLPEACPAIRRREWVESEVRVSEEVLAQVFHLPQGPHALADFISSHSVLLGQHDGCKALHATVFQMSRLFNVGRCPMSTRSKVLISRGQCARRHHC